MVIVGAGLGGIAAAIELKRHGVEDLVLLDAAGGVGGTWRYNDYPGAACDVPSHLYSYSFARRSTWSRLCSPRAEILRYVEQVADVFGIAPLVRTRTRVTACEWDEAARHWVVRTDGAGVLLAGAVVLATGQLHQPAYPSFDGQETFAGRSFHSARWEHDYDLTGKRVAVIGTGASAVQFVPPVAEQVAALTVFQRTGNWIMPRRNNVYPRPIAALFRLFPVLGTVWRRTLFDYLELLTAQIRHPRTLGHFGRVWSALFMRSQLRDPQVRRKAWPDYVFGCKRVLFSSAFLPALQRDNVELVTERIARMTPAGPQTEDGRVHEVDCVIYGTGFRTTEFMFPMEITGVGGRTLREAWADGPRAHLGIAVSGFPSLFVMYGPNTNTSGGSIINYEEFQAAYIRQALSLVRSRRAAALDVRPEVEASFDRETQARFAGTAWTRCDSWYRDQSGRIVANWPGYMREYEAAVRELDPAEFTLVPLPDREPVAA